MATTSTKWTKQTVLAALTSGVRFRYIPHDFAKTGDTSDPRDFWIDNVIVSDTAWNDSPERLLNGLAQEGVVEEREDADTGILEFVLPGDKALWEW